MSTARSRLSYFYLSIFSLWAVAWLFVPYPLEVLRSYWHFFFLGIGGAVAANATGAGGGIAFIPAFTALEIHEQTALGTSIAIQCFGMTVGSISWLLAMKSAKHQHEKVTTLIYQLIFYSGFSSVLGMLAGQYLLPAPDFPVASIFRIFSILFGLALLYISLRKHPSQHTRYILRPVDVFLVTLVGFAGGAVTSWISIGAGEWIALLLIFLGYPTMVSVCVAVCITALTVLAGIPFHLLVTQTISWEILLFAAPAAMLGASFAHALAHRLGPMRLKIFFSVWVLATGVAM